MLIVKVKICGVTCEQDAWDAVDLGADLLGLNFYPKSPRYLSPDQAEALVKKMPAFVSMAGVFVNASLETIRAAIDRCHLDWVQLHGNESPEFCESLRGDNVKIMKALRVREQDDIQRADDYAVDAILLDAFHPDQYGGTGVAFDWSLVKHTGKRVFLAGGIKPENAAQAVELGVYGIDLCSGVESEPGRKDRDKMKTLFDNIRHLRG